MEYRLYITNHFGAHIKHLIPNTDEIFDYKELIHDTIHNNIIVAVLLPSPLSGSLSVINSSFNWTKMTQTIDMESQGKGDANSIRKDSIDVYDCINKFIEREQLAETETIYCSECKQHLPPIKKMDLFSTPDILIIQLKRFQFVPGQYFIHREKINDVIHFPIEGLDLRKYVLGYPPKKLGIEREIGRCDEDQMEGDEEKNLIYDLYAVSHHMGGLGGGHYTATCKNSLNNKW
jgi:ubiquitin carboxyl-terminal hydrolase 4/11/15